MVNVLSICFSALFLSNLALAGAGASNPRGRRHHNSHAEAVQKRAAEEYRAAGLAARSGSTAAAVARKRANSRCGPRNSTTTTTTSITSTVTDPIGNPGGDPTTSPTTTTTVHKNLETTPVAPPATTTTSGGGGAGGATYSGDGTYYAPGLGSCGVTSSSTDNIVAVSQLLYDTWPGATGNPNNNPICGLFITAHYGSKSVRVKVVDRCVGCAKYDLDFSPAAFDQLANEALGRIPITWEFS